MTIVNLDKMTVTEVTLLLTGEKNLDVARQKVYDFGKLIDPNETNDEVVFFNGLWSLAEDWREERAP